MASFEEAKQQWESRDAWYLADREAERRFFYQSGEEGLRAELAAEREKVSALEIKVNNQQDWLVEWRKCEEALEAERKKREEAEMERDNYLRCLNGSTKAKYTAELYDKEVERAEAAEAQVEVLRRSLENISNLKIDPTSPEIFYHHVTDLTSLALADLPARSADIRKVLEAAEEYVVSCQEEAMEPRFLEETNLFETVREWREK